MNGDAIARFYFCGKPNDVPIRQADATVARRASDRIGIIGAVNADAFLVQRNPHHAHRLPRPGCEQVEAICRQVSELQDYREYEAFRIRQMQQAALTVIFCLLALGCVWGISIVMGYDKGLAAGLMAGAVTESATIGSASDAINQLNVPAEVKAAAISHLAVGYSVR